MALTQNPIAEEVALVRELNLSQVLLKAPHEVLHRATACMASLTSLNLAENYIGEEGTRYVAEQLAVNTCLTRLNLATNGIGCVGARRLGEALVVNTTLTELNLARNFLTAAAAGHLANALLDNATLQTLGLEGNSLRATGAERLIALKGNDSLTCLDLSDNEIGPEGAAFLGDLLRGHRSLTELRLDQNFLSGGSISALVEGLRENASLTSLSLPSNAVDASGVKSLALWLSTRSVGLKELDLTGNVFACAGAGYLAEMLHVNESLESLILVECRIGEEGAQLLAAAVKPNATLRILNLSRNNFFEPHKFRESLQFNFSLTHILNNYHSILPEQDEGWAVVKDLLAKNKEGPIILQLRPSNSFKVDDGSQLHLELLKMSGEKRLDLTVSSSVTVADFADGLKELIGSHQRRFVVVLPSGEKLHRLAKEAMLKQALAA